MNNSIRQAVPLPEALEDQIFEMQHEAYTFLEQGKKEQALGRILQVWDLLPAPKFNTSCSQTVLCDLIDILSVVGRYEEAQEILEDWRLDAENCGYRIFDTTVYILSAENFLFLDQIDAAIACFKKASACGASKRDFSGRPTFYFDIAQGLLIDHTQIRNLFLRADLNKSQVEHGSDELSAAVLDQLEEFIALGNSYFDEEKFADAIHVWQKALLLIPSPQNGYAESQWLESSIGDAYFLIENFPEALDYFERAKGNIQEIAYENPFIMLRLGQCFLEDNQMEQAAEFLLRAYMLEGKEIFEDEDAKYFDFLETHVKLD